MLKEVLLASLFFVITFSNVQFTAFASSQDEVGADEYGVYSALLRQSYISADDSQLVIENYTQDTSVYYGDDITEHFTDVKKRLPSLSQDAIDDFRRRNNGSQLLRRSFHLGIEYTLISKDRFEGFAGPDERMEMSRVGWERFYREYPGVSGVLLLSRVGFNRNKSQALVFVMHIRGNPSGRWWGDGSYVLLSKKTGLWRVRRRTVILVH